MPSLVLNDKSINSIKVPPELTDLLQFHSNLAESVRFERFLQNCWISKGNPPDLRELPVDLFRGKSVLSYQTIQDLHDFKSTVGHSRLEWGTSIQWGIVGHIESVGHSEAHQVDGA